MTELSIIIPLYNAEPYLEGLIENVISLNDPNAFEYEIILVDDGSSDETPALCKKTAENHGFVRWFRQNNAGIAAARNVGLMNAQGRFVTYIDQDDKLTCGYGEFLKKCMDSGCDLLITTPKAVDTDGNHVGSRIFEEKEYTDPRIVKGMARKLIDNDILNSPEGAPSITTSVWNCLFLRETIIDNNLRFKRFIDYEDDWIFMIEMLSVSRKVLTAKTGYYLYIVSRSSESHRTKYITDLQEKRQQWMLWLNSILLKLNTPESEIAVFFDSALRPRNVLICFKNACFRPDYSRVIAVKEIQKACSRDGWDLDEISLSCIREVSRLDRFWLFLLKNHLFSIAVILNRAVFRKRFH